jgi:citrate synthase
MKPKSNTKEHGMMSMDTLLKNEDNLETDLGAWFPGERVVYRGKDLFSDLNNLSWMGLMMYGITGKLMNETQLKLFEGIWSLSVSYPDPRLWNNRVAALAGTAQSTVSLGVGAATAVTEAKIYGGQANHGAIEFLKRAAQAYQPDQNSLGQFITSELKRNRSLPGYGRPLVRTDERIAPLMNLVTKLGYEKGEILQLAFKIERYLKDERRRLCMNITGVAAALCADQGLTTRQYTAYAAIAFNAGIVPCYLDAVDKPNGSFFPLRCDRLQYHGPEQRNWE